MTNDAKPTISKEAFINQMRDKRIAAFTLGDLLDTAHLLDRKKPISATEATLREARHRVASYILTTSHDFSWSDMIGNEDAIAAIQLAVEAPFRHENLYRAYGMKPERGAVLFGPPGCGKTMLAKIAAATLAKLHGADVEMISLSAAELKSKYYGQTDEIIRAIFKYAQLYKKHHGHQLVIFIDEADAFLMDRDLLAWSYEAGHVSTFLSEMDGLDENGAFVLLATNRVEKLDPALLRDGRCSRKIEVKRPTYAGAIEFLRRGLAAARTPLDPAALADYFLSPDRIVSRGTVVLDDQPTNLNLTLAHIMNGAMLTSVVERAKAFAFRRDIESGSFSGLTYEDCIAAIEELVTENAKIPHHAAIKELIHNYVNKEMKKGMN